MKKIPTLFERQFENRNVAKILPNVTSGFEWVLNGEGIATVKWDGACCAVISGELYKRYDAKHGKPVPEGAIRCQEEADPVTGHLPCWVKCERTNPSDKWFFAAYDNTMDTPDGTYEAIGPHFRSNPYMLKQDVLKPHGKCVIEVPRDFDGIREYLSQHCIEGIVFWKDGEPKCKIKRTDFGFHSPTLKNSDLVTIELQIDAELKNEAEKICAEIGLTLEEATILFFQECIRLGRLPFEVSEEEMAAAQKAQPAERSQR